MSLSLGIGEIIYHRCTVGNTTTGDATLLIVVSPAPLPSYVLRLNLTSAVVGVAWSANSANFGNCLNVDRVTLTLR